MNAAAKHGGSIDWASVRARLDTLANQSAHDARRRQELLQLRAAQLARPLVAVEAGTTLRVLQLQLATQRCALETRYVTEVRKPDELTKLPGAPPQLLGLMNLRGEILPVFDLRLLLHTGQGEASDEARFIMLGRDVAEVALFVERVHEIVGLGESELLDPTLSAAAASAAYVRGVTQDALVVIDALALLESRELYLGDEISTSLEVNP